MSFIKAGLTLISKNKMDKIPQIFSMGGFYLRTPKGLDLCFDWNQSSWSEEINEDGYLQYEVDMRDFDYEFFEDSNKELGFDVEDFTPEFIVSCELGEAFYECFDEENNDGNRNEDIPYPLAVTAFEVYGEEAFEFKDGDTDDHILKFPKEELDRYDKEEAIYHQWEEE